LAKELIKKCLVKICFRSFRQWKSK